MKDIITESIRYWEARRLVFNAVWAMVASGITIFHHESLSALTGQSVAGLLLMAMVANSLYCFVYLAEIFIQMSDNQQVWKQRRRVVLIAGTILAVAIFLITHD
jgi:hypothetical protein